MVKVGVAILGFGTVGGGTFEILNERKQVLRDEYGVEVTVEAILVRDKKRAIEKNAPEELLTTDINEIIENKKIDIIAECIGGIEPAKSYMTAALNAGKSVVTANKELFSKHWCEIEEARAKSGAGTYFEATCAGGVPIIRTLTEAMQANKIKEIKGIINGTTNYILSRMTEEGARYKDVLKDAQALGFAEADPTADVEGYDACYKLSILSSLAFEKFLPVDAIYREGISKVSAEDIAFGKKFNLTIKLLAIAKDSDDGKVEARVHPVFLRNTHPLANVNGSFNAVYLVGDSVGDIMLYGKGAGARPTGSAVVSDIVFCARQLKHAAYPGVKNVVKSADVVHNFESDYYIRLKVCDKVGVLADIARIFADNNVSITSVRQDAGEETVQVILVTHRAKENDVRTALKSIKALENVISCVSLIRVEK